jgi:hypothetical protein
MGANLAQAFKLSEEVFIVFLFDKVDFQLELN